MYYCENQQQHIEASEAQRKKAKQNNVTDFGCVLAEEQPKRYSPNLFRVCNDWKWYILSSSSGDGGVESGNGRQSERNGEEERRCKDILHVFGQNVQMNRYRLTKYSLFDRRDYKLVPDVLRKFTIFVVVTPTMAACVCATVTCISIDKIMMLSLQIWLKMSLRIQWNSPKSEGIESREWQQKKKKMFIHRLSIDVERMAQELKSSMEMTICAHSMQDDCSPILSLPMSSARSMCQQRVCVYLFSFVIWLNFWFSIIPLICSVFVFRIDAIASTYILNVLQTILNVLGALSESKLSVKFIFFSIFLLSSRRRGIVALVKLYLLWIFAIHNSIVRSLALSPSRRNGFEWMNESCRRFLFYFFSKNIHICCRRHNDWKFEIMIWLVDSLNGFSFLSEDICRFPRIFLWLAGMKWDLLCRWPLYSIFVIFVHNVRQSDRNLAMVAHFGRFSQFRAHIDITHDGAPLWQLQSQFVYARAICLRFIRSIVHAKWMPFRVI